MNVFSVREKLIEISSKLGLYSIGRSVWKLVFKPVFLKYESRKFHKNSSQVLAKIGEAFKEANVKSWLVYGTLLGYVREGDFIQYDNDIDLGLFMDDRSANLQSTLERHGFKKVREYLVDNGEYGVEESYEFNGVVVDLFYIKKVNEKYTALTFYAEEGISMSQTIKKLGGLLVKEFYFTPYELKPIRFKGADIFIPEPAQLYLEEYYGPNFMVPDPNWVTGMAGNSKELTDKIGVQALFLK